MTTFLSNFVMISAHCWSMSLLAQWQKRTFTTSASAVAAMGTLTVFAGYKNSLFRGPRTLRRSILVKDAIALITWGAFPRRRAIVYGFQARSQPGYIFGGEQNVCNLLLHYFRGGNGCNLLLCPSTKHDFENFEGWQSPCRPLLVAGLLPSPCLTYTGHFQRAFAR